MKTIFTSALSLLLVGAVAQNKSSVNIVFTDAARLATIDTLISTGEEDLEHLLESYGLNEHNTHRIDISGEGNVHVVKLEKEFVFVDSEGESHGLERGDKRVSVAVFTEEDHDDEDDHATDGKGLHEENEVRIEKRIKKNADGEIEEMEVRIEKSIENGVEVSRAYINGEEETEDMAEAHMDKHRAEMEKEGAQPCEKNVFVYTNTSDDGITAIASHEETDHVKAIVLVKQVNSAKAARHSSSGVRDATLMLSPNPARAKATVQMKDVSGDYLLCVCALNGEMVLKQRGNTAQGTSVDLNLEGIAPGTYLCTLSHDQGVVTQKLMVE